MAVRADGNRNTPATFDRRPEDSKANARWMLFRKTFDIGKREVGRRGVRIYSEVTEKPVEKQVNLRDEKIRVDRQPVNREASPGDIDTFKEGQIELTEKREEPVVSKTARVVEEVRVGKDVNERTETVRDTVRRKDVRVEETGGTRADYDEDFRTDYQDTVREKRPELRLLRSGIPVRKHIC